MIKTMPLYLEEFFKLNAMFNMNISLIDQSDVSYQPRHKQNLIDIHNFINSQSAF